MAVSRSLMTLRAGWVKLVCYSQCLHGISLYISLYVSFSLSHYLLHICAISISISFSFALSFSVCVETMSRAFVSLCQWRDHVSRTRMSCYLPKDLGSRTVCVCVRACVHAIPSPAVNLLADLRATHGFVEQVATADMGARMSRALLNRWRQQQATMIRAAAAASRRSYLGTVGGTVETRNGLSEGS